MPRGFFSLAFNKATKSRTIKDGRFGFFDQTVNGVVAEGRDQGGVCVRVVMVKLCPCIDADGVEAFSLDMVIVIAKCFSKACNQRYMSKIHVVGRVIQLLHPLHNTVAVRFHVMGVHVCCDGGELNHGCGTQGCILV